MASEDLLPIITFEKLYVEYWVPHWEANPVDESQSCLRVQVSLVTSYTQVAPNASVWVSVAIPEGKWKTIKEWPVAEYE